jgi:hypothetical protein
MDQRIDVEDSQYNQDHPLVVVEMVLIGPPQILCAIKSQTRVKIPSFTIFANINLTALKISIPIKDMDRYNYFFGGRLVLLG